MSTIFVIFGVVVALLALVWRPNALKNFPQSLSIIIVGLLIQYEFFSQLEKNLNLKPILIPTPLKETHIPTVLPLRVNCFILILPL